MRFIVLRLLNFSNVSDLSCMLFVLDLVGSYSGGLYGDSSSS